MQSLTDKSNALLAAEHRSHALTEQLSRADRLHAEAHTALTAATQQLKEQREKGTHTVAPTQTERDACKVCVCCIVMRYCIMLWFGVC
jgi:hypothetical protein